MPLALGVDIGTTNTKVALVDVGADDVRVGAVAVTPTPEPGDLRVTMLGLFRQVLAGEAAPVAVGIASMAETGVALDSAGVPLGPWLRWNAHPARAEADALARLLGREHLIGATGVRPSAKVPLALWAWLRAHRPDTWSAMAAWSGAADLAAYLFTGRLATDHTLAGRTMAYRLPATGEILDKAFDADLLAEVGLRPEQLPDVVPPGEIAGRVRDATFVPAGTPVVVAGHDHAVGSWACGVREPGDVADSVGTAEAVMTVVAGEPDPVPVGRAGMSTVITVAGRHRAVLAGSSSAGAVVDWWLAHEAVGLGPEGLFELVRAAGDAPTGVLVLPYLAGRQAPEPDPDARLRILGRRPGQEPAVLAKALLEGLCLQTRWMLAEQARLAGGTAEPTVHLFGSPVAANPAWARVKAHVLPGELRLIPEREPVAAGAAVLAAVRAGCAEPPALELSWQNVPGGGVDYGPMLADFIAAATAKD